MLLIAHRCGPDIYPEQTMASARRALKQGADIIEMDVQFTSDGIPVICHDPNAKRIFGVDSLVSDMTLADFLAMRHVENRTYASHSLDDVLSAGIAPILLHCKNVGEKLERIVEHIAAFQYGDKIIMGVLEPEDVGVVRAVDPNVRTLAFMRGTDATDTFIEAGVDIIRLWEPWVTQERIDHIHAQGKQVWIMVGKPEPKSVGHTTKEALCSFIRMGADGVLIDDVLWARGILSREA